MSNLRRVVSGYRFGRNPSSVGPSPSLMTQLSNVCLHQMHRRHTRELHGLDLVGPLIASLGGLGPYIVRIRTSDQEVVRDYCTKPPVSWTNVSLDLSRAKIRLRASVHVPRAYIWLCVRCVIRRRQRISLFIYPVDSHIGSSTTHSQKRHQRRPSIPAHDRIPLASANRDNQATSLFWNLILSASNSQRLHTIAVSCPHRNSTSPSSSSSPTGTTDM